MDFKTEEYFKTSSSIMNVLYLIILIPSKSFEKVNLKLKYSLISFNELLKSSLPRHKTSNLLF